jgi:hypothetical protein
MTVLLFLPTLINEDSVNDRPQITQIQQICGSAGFVASSNPPSTLRYSADDGGCEI